ncbi:LysR family transcriptional regulator substrate-binding protein [Serinibacter arcticus]|uniref:LysR family transcriptional regulator substrate-binding protein n=1 Tax=Serinibacter arcticus TaxID=1655435 RepID=UPI0018EE9001|nr:LysR family transcriptional regulator substrate-binding protein [Serinibacter arcticus]
MDSNDTLRLLIVPGVSPGRWVSTWKERHRAPIEVEVADASAAEQRLLGGDGDAAFLRLPVTDDTLAVIPLWVEESVVVVPKEDELSLLERLSPADLAEHVVIVAGDDVLHWADGPGTAFTGVVPATAADAIELVAAGAGVTVVPASLARAHTRKDVVAVPLVEGPTSQVGLAWVPVDGAPTPAVDDLIGIVRGRTANSSRGRDAQVPAERPTAKAKAARAEKAARAAAARGGRRRVAGAPDAPVPPAPEAAARAAPDVVAPDADAAATGRHLPRERRRPRHRAVPGASSW